MRVRALTYSNAEVGTCYCFHYFDYNEGDWCFESSKEVWKVVAVVGIQAQGTSTLFHDPNDLVLAQEAKEQNVLLGDHNYAWVLVEASWIGIVFDHC